MGSVTAAAARPLKWRMSPQNDDAPAVLDDWPQPTPEVLRLLESRRTWAAAWADDSDAAAEKLDS